MADHLKADLGRIGATAAQLSRIRADFDGAGHLIDQYDGFLGSAELAGTMHDFAGNWSYHRKKLTGALGTLSEWCHAAADVYKGTDDQLAAALSAAQAKADG